MKIYFYPDKGEKDLIFETVGDLMPEVGDKVIIKAFAYVITKKVFYYNKSTTCCLLYLDSANDKLEIEKIKI